MSAKMKVNERLSAALASKTRAVLAALSEVGFGEDEAEQLIEEFEEAMEEGETAEEWRARETRIADSDIGRLLLERYEIEQQLLDDFDSQRPAARVSNRQNK
jgi:hypothetical protein